MNTFELQYGQVNNVLLTFNTSNLPIGLFSSFKWEKLEVSTSNSLINKALDKNLHDKTIIVKINWGKYTMMQPSEVFTLTVKYNNKVVEALIYKFRVNFEKKNPSTKVSISKTQVMWDKDMSVDLIIEPKHPQSENWKYLPSPKVLKIPFNSNFKPVDGKLEVRFNVFEKKTITLKYEHSKPIMPPITKNLPDKIDVIIGEERKSLDITLIPNNNPRYGIDIRRLAPSYTIGSNALDLWKLQIINENPYAVLSINDVIIKRTDKLNTKALNEYEWVISLKSKNTLKKIPTSSIYAEVEIQAIGMPCKPEGLILSTQPVDDDHFVSLKEKDRLQLDLQNDVKLPIVVYRDNSPRTILFNLRNLSPIVVENIIISSSNDNVQIAEDCRQIKVLNPNQDIPVSVITNSNIIGIKESIICVKGDYTKDCPYKLNYELKEKKHCTLNVGIDENSFVETFAGEEYTNHKVCEIKLAACVDENYGTEGSLPIKVNDIKVSPLFSILSNTKQIEPGKTIKCDLVLNGVIDSGEEVNDFNKYITFKYEHK